MIRVTPEAAEKINKMIKTAYRPEVPPKTAGLRIGLKAGGCSGFQYYQIVADRPNDEDHIIETTGIRIFIDRRSMKFLEGTTIDYVPNDLMKRGLIFINPRVSSTCGCGISIEIKKAPDKES